MIGVRPNCRRRWRRAAPVLPDEFDHLLQRRSRKKNAAHAFFAHDGFIVAGDRPAAAAKEADVGRAIVAQSIDHLGKEFDMAAVIAGDADCPYILLHRRPRDVASRTVIAEINHLDPVADEFQIDGAYGAVVAVANGNGGEETDWSGRSFAHIGYGKCRRAGHRILYRSMRSFA